MQRNILLVRCYNEAMKWLIIVIIAIVALWLLANLIRLQWRRSLPRRMELMAKETQKAIERHQAKEK